MQCAGNRRADLQRGAARHGRPLGGRRHRQCRLDRRRARRRAAGGRRRAGRASTSPSPPRRRSRPRMARAPYGVSIPLAKALSPRRAAGLRDERRAARRRARLSAARRGAGLCRGAQPEMARSHHGAGRALRRPPAGQRDYKLCPPDMRRPTQRPVAAASPSTPCRSTRRSASRRAGAALKAGPVDRRAATPWRPAAPSRGSTCRATAAGAGAGDDRGPRGALWCWTFWHGRLDLPPGEHELCVRAWDAAGQTQPALPGRRLELQGLPQRRLAPGRRDGGV